MMRKNLPGPARPVVTALLPIAFLALGAAACSDSSPTEPLPDPVVYQGQIAAVEAFPDVSGGVTLALLAGGFEIEVAMEGAPEAAGEGFPWMLRDGTCTDPGAFLGEWEEFPAIELDEEGRWEAEVDVALSQDAEGFVVDFRRSTEDLEIPLACAEVTLDPTAS